jgi:sterol 3beta-glucosyltransferase
VHLVVATVGTRGDVQPYVALGVGLARAGHRVTVATHEDFRELVTSRGLGFRAVGGSFKQLVESEDGRRWLDSSDRPLRYARTLKRLFVPLQQRWNEDLRDAVADADAVLFYGLATGALHAAQARGIPAIVLYPFPAVPSSELTPILFRSRPVLRGLANRLLWELAMWGFWQPFMALHQRWRERLGLPRVRERSVWKHVVVERIPTVHLYSEHLVPRPTDWPGWVHNAGFCFLDGDGWTPPAALAAFMAAGPPPVYVGFGSMTGRDPAELYAMAVDAVRRAGQRVVLVTGWGGGGLDAAHGGDDVFVADDVPHDWLFPRCRAVVHHGGIGTTAAGLRAGKPTLVTAFFGDQPYWGRTVFELGVGPRPILRRELSVDRLASAITELTGDEQLARNAERLGERLRGEDGVGRAVEIIERILAG